MALDPSRFHLIVGGDENPLPHFFGTTHTALGHLRALFDTLTGPQHIYVYGHTNATLWSLRQHLGERWKVHVIWEDGELQPILLCTETVVHLHQVPINIHDAAVFIPSFFRDTPNDYFQQILTEHAFQTLTESTKPGTAHRLGIYLSKHVPREYRFLETDLPDSRPQKHYLLRCSTNLSGPTEWTSDTDYRIIDRVNHEAAKMFCGQAELNHVLAQLYRNVPAAPGVRETKAKIKDHSDKTKDMPDNGLMAFCTFYDTMELQRLTPFQDTNEWCSYPDYVHGTRSGLTQLLFHGKSPDAPSFAIPLSHESLLLIPLSTNRRYTHEIRPSVLSANLIPTRLGYVIRCSNTTAHTTDGTTYVEEDAASQPIALRPPRDDEVEQLRHLYAEENRHDQGVVYPPLPFSMNHGDYQPCNASQPEDVCRTTVARCGLRVTEQLALARCHLFQQIQADVPMHQIADDHWQATLTASSFRAIHRHVVTNLTTTTAYLGMCGLRPPAAYTAIRLDRCGRQEISHTLSDDVARDPKSRVALVSWYQDPRYSAYSHRLVLRGEDRQFELTLIHGSVFVFSAKSYRRYQARIVPLENNANVWLGMTLYVN